MISRLGVGTRWLRRILGRTHWAARFLGHAAPPGEAAEPGVIMIQIDGLSRTQFEAALENGRLPFLARLLERQHFTLETLYSGLPSTTPAVQGEIFFGIPAAVPAFQFFRRAENRDYSMYEADSAERIEAELRARCPHPLLSGGHGYSNIYRAGAVSTHYCSADFAPAVLAGKMSPAKLALLVVLYLPKILRAAGLALLEILLAVTDAVRGMFARYHVLAELKFVPARIGVCILLREAVRFRILLDIERGIRVIHGNFLGYDEQSHRRGPDSAFAHWTLKGIDRAIRDIHRAAHRSGYRDYETIVYSDHGQESATPYRNRAGRPLETAVAAAFSGGPLAGIPVWKRQLSSVMGNAIDKCLGLFGKLEKSRAIQPPPDGGREIVITAMGPLGHIYLPPAVGEIDMEAHAEALVRQAEIPLVLLREAGGRVRAVNSRGSWVLPADCEEILGANHPFLQEATGDLVSLCGHPDAGDFLISGWDPQAAPVTFAMENGAHGGPGSEETRGFLLVPDRIRRWHLAHLAATRTRVRGMDLHRIVGHYLGHDRREQRALPRPAAAAATLGVMTYNIHSCRGLDGKTRPERIARVIDHFDADIVAVQEVDCHRTRSGGRDQAGEIAASLHFHHVFQAVFEESREKYGIAVFSKHPIELVKMAHLTPAMPARRREARGAIWVKIRPEGGRGFHFICTHFGLGRDERLRQAEVLLGDEWLGAIPDSEPVIVCGDLNSNPASRVLKLLRSRLHDVLLHAPGPRVRPSFPSSRPLLRIDHILTSRHFETSAVEVLDTHTAIVASDHLPVCAELSWKP